MLSKGYRDQYRNPGSILYDLIKKFAVGELQDKFSAPTVFHRAVVMAVDVIGGQLECEKPGSKNYVEHILEDGQKVKFDALIGPSNPVNSIKARIITDGFDQFYSDSKLRVFWPLLPEHMMIPIKPGEHVYVMFEDENKRHGLWFGKVPGHEGFNFVDGASQFDSENNGNLSQLFPDSAGENQDKQSFNDKRSITQSSIKEKRLASKFSL